MKPTLQLKASQQLSMTPQLQQAIRLLQLSRTELLEEIRDKLDSNPLLEEAGVDNSGNDASDVQGVDTPADEWDQLSFGSGGGEEDELAPEGGRPAPETLRDHLLWQLGLTRLSPTDLAIGYALIDAIDERGYLVSPLDEIADACREWLPEPPEEDEILAVLHAIQQFEPTGVGARHLAECLTLQLQALPADTPHRSDALALLAKLGQGLDARALKGMTLGSELLALLRQLDPAPGESFSEASDDALLPDVIVRRHEKGWQVFLNPQTLPKLGINRHYAALARNEGNTGQYLRGQLQEARFFIRSIENRQETLLKVARAIVELQRGFFEYGEEAMKPLVMTEVAKAVGMHESTISRVTAQKYMLTPRGLFELRFFFSSHVETEDGGECSSTAIRAIIKKLVADEDPRKPLSDSRLETLLKAQGIQVARRTIAKYREALRIPSSSERKRVL